MESFDLLGGNNNPYWKQQVFADSRESAAKSPLKAHIFGTNIDGWTPYTVDSANWFMIQFNTLKVVTGIAIAGHATQDEFIQTYHVKWSHTGYDYTFNYCLGLDGNPKVKITSKFPPNRFYRFLYHFFLLLAIFRSNCPQCPSSTDVLSTDENQKFDDCSDHLPNKAIIDYRCFCLHGIWKALF